ncbi:MAG: hypothetical protein D6784_05700 [Chloroflexi bacterium]|nr:MAG: hypothetical protein D6784_05700 [Chloroflexota bacterium]
MVIITLPRFNRNDFGVKAFTSGGKLSTTLLGDAAQYVAFTQYFRNNIPASDLIVPFVYRPLVPFVAAQLPFSPMTAINIINLLGLLGGLVFLDKLLSTLNISQRFQMLGNLMFVFSFPTFYYATIGYIDPVLIGFLILGTYFIFVEKWVFLIFVIGVGALAKETILLLLPVLTTYLLITGKLWTKQGVSLPLGGLVYGLSIYLVRAYSPVSVLNFVWMPSMERFWFNILRPRSYISFLLTFGIPGILALSIFYPKNQHLILSRWRVITLPLIVGYLLSITLFFYSMFSAYADGRFIWTSYPFSIPLATIIMEKMWGKLSYGEFERIMG